MARAVSCRRGLPLFALLAVLLACSSSSSQPDSGGNTGQVEAGATTGSIGGGVDAGGATTGAATTFGGAAMDAGADQGDGGATTSSAGGTTLTTAGDSAGGAGGNAGIGENPTNPDATDLGPVTVYYLDVTRDRVMRMGAEGGEPEVLVEGAGQGPDGVAVDPAAGHIYWTDMGVPADDDGFLLRSELDGSNVTTIVEPGKTFTPKQLKVELASGMLYWSDREGMRVQRCNLDGSELQTLVTIAQGDQARADRANHAVGVSVDPEGGYLYWIQKGAPNAGEGSIRRAALEVPEGQTHDSRMDIEVLYAGLPEPIDLDVDVAASMMYWTDRGDGTINRAPVQIPEGASATTREDRQILVENVEVAIGIWLDLPLGHVYYTGNDVVGRVNLDGTGNTVLVDNAGVLTGITAVRLP